RNAYVLPEKVAVVHGARRYTYRQLEERANRLASALRRKGLRKRDRVAFLCPNIPAMLEAHFGVPMAGGVLVAINIRLSTDEIGEILETAMTWDTHYLWTLPMFHCNGWCFTWAVTAVGGTHHCLRKVDPGTVWDALDHAGITHYNGAPTVQIGIVNHPKAHHLARQVTVTV